jgi:hypothetical protein
LLIHLFFFSCLDMENTVEEGAKGKRPIAASASAKRAKTIEHPPKPKRKHKRPTQPEPVEYEHPETEHHANVEAMDENPR